MGTQRMGNSKIAVTVSFSGTTSLIYKVETESQGGKEDDNQRESKYQVSRCYALCGGGVQGSFKQPMRSRGLQGADRRAADRGGCTLLPPISLTVWKGGLYFPKQVNGVSEWVVRGPRGFLSGPPLWVLPDGMLEIWPSFTCLLEILSTLDMVPRGHLCIQKNPEVFWPAVQWTRHSGKLLRGTHSHKVSKSIQSHIPVLVICHS